MISIKPNKNITTINISSKVFDNKRPYTPNQQPNISKSSAISHCNTRFKFSYKMKHAHPNSKQTSTPHHHGLRKQTPNTTSTTQHLTTTHHHQTLQRNHTLQKQNNQVLQDGQEFCYSRRFKSARENISTLQTSSQQHSMVQKHHKAKYHYKNGSFLKSQQLSFPKTNQSLHLQSKTKETPSIFQPNFTKNINDSCIINSISLANPIYNNHKKYLLNKSLNETQDYRIDVNREYNLREIYLQDLQKIQLSRVKAERNHFSSAHTTQRKKRSGKKTIQLLEDLQPRPWQSQQKNSLQLFTKDTIA